MIDSTRTTAGWIVLLAAVAMLFSLISIDLIAIHDGWAKLSTPMFVGTIIGHFATVITAFIGGKLIPVERDSNVRTRDTDIVVDGSTVKKVVEIKSIVTTDVADDSDKK